MTTQTEALKLALRAIREILSEPDRTLEQRPERREMLRDVVIGLQEALAQPEQEQEAVVVMELYTVGWDLVENIDIDWLESLPLGTKLYAHPPVQKLGMTEEEFKNDKYA